MTRCREVLELLDDYVDGYLSGAEARLVETHLPVCRECRGEERALRALIARAQQLPKRVEPGRDLWPEIEARVSGRRTRWFGSGGMSMGPRLLAAAAMVLVIAGAWFAVGPGSSLGPADPPVGGDIPALTAEQEFEAVKRDLLAALDNADEGLPPEVAETVWENLRIIEDAVAEIRLALADSPDNPHLERILIATYKSQIDLLRRSVTLAHAS